MQSQQHEEPLEQSTWEGREQLRKLEEVVQNGLSYWREAAEALLEIRDKKLYKQANFSTFESYVKSKWSMARAYAYKLIGAAVTASEVEEKMSTRVDISNHSSTISNASPSVFQALSPLPKEERADAYLEIVAQNNGQIPTVAQVARTVTHATSERIGRLDTDRTAKAPPAAAAPKFPGKTFRLHDFRMDETGNRVHVKVFKPANTFKGYEAKIENLSISFSDFVWEVGQMGFVLQRSGEETRVTETAAEEEEDDLPGPFTAGRDWSALDALTEPQPDIAIGIAEQAMNLMFADDYPQ